MNILQIYLWKALRAISNYILNIEIKAQVPEERRFTQASGSSFVCKFLLEPEYTKKNYKMDGWMYDRKISPGSSLHQLN